MRALVPAPAGPDGGTALNVHAHYADGWVDTDGVRVNFVASVDGSASAAGLSRGLQTPGDNVVFAALRDLADVILVGAATAAAESYRPSNPSAARQETRRRYGFADAPAIAVMSGSLELDLTSPLFTEASRAPTLIVTGSAAPIGRRNDIIDLAGGDTRLQLVEAPAGPDGGVDFGAAVVELHNRGYRRILCEGGPRLFGAGVAAGAVDEVCLSVSPMLTGPAGPRILGGAAWPDGLAARLTLTGLLIEDDALFSRYSILPAD